MGYKSRENYAVNGCFRKCANRGKKCGDCVANRGYKPIKKQTAEAENVR